MADATPTPDITNHKAHAAGAAGFLLTLIAMQVDPASVEPEAAKAASDWLAELAISFVSGAGTWLITWFKQSYLKKETTA